MKKKRSLASCIQEFWPATILTPIFVIGEVAFDVLIPLMTGKLLDEKVTVEGMVSVVLRSFCEDGRYWFQTNGEGICKSPMGMFDAERIPNDLKAVDDAIRGYWDMEPLGGTDDAAVQA